MARHRKDLGERKHERIECRRPGFVIPAPDAPWIECFIVDISESGVCLDVGALPVPKMFGLAFTSCGTVVRVCLRAARRTARRAVRHRKAASPGRKGLQRSAPCERAGLELASASGATIRTAFRV